MCASSCARIASSCCGRQPGQRAGRQQDDRLQPADDGRHVDERATRAGGPCARCAGCARAAAPICWQRLARRRRAVRLHPLHPEPAARTAAASSTQRRRASTPRTSQGSHGVERAGSIALERRPPAVESTRRRPAPRLRGRGSRPGASRGAGARRAPAMALSRRRSVAARCRALNVWSAVTTGIVSISDSAIAATT